VVVRPLNFAVRCSTVALVRLVSPDSDPEIVAIVAMLEAHGIPCYVRGAGFGGLFPGVQINAYNTRDIMIPEEQIAEALELLKDFESRPPDREATVEPRKSGKLRNLFEFLLFGWFVPRSAAHTEKRDAPAGDMGRTPSDTSRPRQRLLPVVLVGAAAGLLGSLVMVWLNPSGVITTASIYGGALFLAALAAVQFAPARLLEVWGILFAGVAIGVFLSVLVNPTLADGERNLWPFEVATFWVVGLLPAWIGLFVGRELITRPRAPSPTNNRSRGS
jgi:hypothetical protein